jgi:N-acetylglucosamine-6-phosphate deacetylase
MTTIIKNGHVYDTVLKRFSEKDIEIRDGIIVSVRENIPCDGVTVDCTGKYVIPGLVDVHTHGRAGCDFNTADAAQCLYMRRKYAQAGTTTVMATLASAPMEAFLDSAEAVGKNRDETPGLCTIAGIHLEGRYLNPKRRGAHAPELLHAPDTEELDMLMDRMSPLPFHVSAAYELEGGEQFLLHALSRGATCGLAHTDATYGQAERYADLGVTSFTHTFNAMRGIHHREPGCAVASLMDDRVYTELICDGHHVHPAMIKLAAKLKDPDKLVLITDSLEAAGSPDGEYNIAGMPVTVKDGIALTPDGALAGSTLDLFSGLLNFMSFTGMELEQALPFATINPARMVRADGRCGSLSEGKRADFIIIDSRDKPEPGTVYCSGAPVSIE